MPRITNIQARKGTATDWSTQNPVLASGELGYDLTNRIFKIGDGSSNWNTLSTINLTSSNITDFNSAISGVLPVKSLSAGDNITISSISGVYTINSTGGGGSSSSNVGVRGVISTTGNLSSFAVSGGYPVGYLDLFQDGVKLVSDLDFSATDGSNVTLSNSVPSGTVIEYLTMASGVSSAGGVLSGSVTVPGLGDQYIGNVSLLLSFDGNLTDRSNSPKTVTALGNAAATGIAKFGSASLFLDGNGDGLQISGLPTGTEDFTVEFQIRKSSSWTAETGNRYVFDYADSDSNLSGGFQVYLNGSAGVLRCSRFGVGVVLDYNISSLTANTWYHFAYVRSGTTVTLYRDGSSVASATGFSSSFGAPVAGLQAIGIGSYLGSFQSASSWDGQIDEVRITRGIARTITAAPTAAYPTDLILPVTITGSSGSSSGLSWSSVPASSSASGTTGQIAYDSNYFYIATNTNTWKRSSLASWPLVSMNYLLVAGGGGGGNGRGGGGGAGGYVYSATSVPVGESISVTVGGGGAGSANSVVAQNGSNSSIALPSETIVAVGGGGGADGLKGLFTGSGMAGASGGSGGGGSGYNPVGDGGSGTVDQGYAGGAGYGSGEPYGGGGGGGAGGVGGSGQTANGGVGKADTMLVVVSAGVDIGGTRYVAGGGGAGSYNYTPGNGGSGGGGNGGNTNADGTNGVANTGGGGGGGGNSANGGSGGSGVVILRCPDSFTATTTGSPSTYVTGGYRYYKFTQNGTITFSVV